MNKWNPARAEAIRKYVDAYFMKHHVSPTVREITAGTGISKTAVQRYLVYMREHGEIEYDGQRSIGANLSRTMTETTPAVRLDTRVSCGLPSEPNVIESEIIPLPTAIVGEKLSPELVHQFFSKIVIHEPYRADKRRHQQIDIYYRGVGLVHVPDPDEMERLFQENLTNGSPNETTNKEKNPKKEKTA